MTVSVRGESGKQRITHQAKGKDEASGSALLAHILSEMGFKNQASNHFKMKVIPATGEPFILNDSKPYAQQGLRSGDAIELLYTGELVKGVDDSGESDIWGQFGVLKRDDFRKAVSPIGPGTTGFVFPAEAIRANIGCPLVALKELTKLSLENETTRNELVRDLQIMKECNHPAVMKLIGVIPPDEKYNYLTLVMPHMAGSLKHWIARDPQSVIGRRDLTMLDRFKILYGVACGMKYLHDRGIWRPLQPDNILLPGDGLHPVITDYVDRGAMASVNTITASTMISLAFMAPEWGGGDPVPQSDVYSFGMLTWALLNREFPFHNVFKTPFLMMSHVAKGERPKLEKVPEGDVIGTWMHDTILACWDTDRRPTFAEIVESMDSCMMNAADKMSFQEFQKAYTGYNKVCDRDVTGKGNPKSVANDQDGEAEARTDLSEASELLERGRRYETGDMVNPDFQAALECYRKAAASGIAEAYMRLGHCYMNGIGTIKDKVTGRALMEKAAELRRK